MPDKEQLWNLEDLIRITKFERCKIDSSLLYTPVYEYGGPTCIANDPMDEDIAPSDVLNYFNGSNDAQSTGLEGGVILENENVKWVLHGDWNEGHYHKLKNKREAVLKELDPYLKTLSELTKRKNVMKGELLPPFPLSSDPREMGRTFNIPDSHYQLIVSVKKRGTIMTAEFYVKSRDPIYYYDHEGNENLTPAIKVGHLEYEEISQKK